MSDFVGKDSEFEIAKNMFGLSLIIMAKYMSTDSKMEVQIINDCVGALKKYIHEIQFFDKSKTLDDALKKLESIDTNSMIDKFAALLEDTKKLSKKQSLL